MRLETKSIAAGGGKPAIYEAAPSIHRQQFTGFLRQSRLGPQPANGFGMRWRLYAAAAAFST
jgi:hypothetical protein